MGVLPRKLKKDIIKVSGRDNYYTIASVLREYKKYRINIKVSKNESIIL